MALPPTRNLLAMRGDQVNIGKHTPNGQEPHERETCSKETCGMRPYRTEDQALYQEGYDAGFAAGARRVRNLLDGCATCGMEDDHAWHQTLAECSEAFGRPCEYPSEHHPFA